MAKFFSGLPANKDPYQVKPLPLHRPPPPLPGCTARRLLMRPQTRREGGDAASFASPPGRTQNAETASVAWNRHKQMSSSLELSGGGESLPARAGWQPPPPPHFALPPSGYGGAVQQPAPQGGWRVGAPAVMRSPAGHVPPPQMPAAPPERLGGWQGGGGGVSGGYLPSTGPGRHSLSPQPVAGRGALHPVNMAIRRKQMGDGAAPSWWGGEDGGAGQGAARGQQPVQWGQQQRRQSQSPQPPPQPPAQKMMPWEAMHGAGQSKHQRAPEELEWWERRASPTTSAANPAAAAAAQPPEPPRPPQPPPAFHPPAPGTGDQGWSTSGGRGWEPSQAAAPTSSGLLDALGGVDYRVSAAVEQGRRAREEYRYEAQRLQQERDAIDQRLRQLLDRQAREQAQFRVKWELDRQDRQEAEQRRQADQRMRRELTERLDDSRFGDSEVSSGLLDPQRLAPPQHSRGRTSRSPPPELPEPAGGSRPRRSVSPAAVAPEADAPGGEREDGGEWDGREVHSPASVGQARGEAATPRAEEADSPSVPAYRQHPDDERPIAAASDGLYAGGGDDAPAEKMATCDICSRKFAASRLERHKEICQRKQTEKPRKPFDPKAKRVSNAEHAKFAAEAEKRDRAYQKKIKKADWREQSRAFREAINMTGAPKGEEEED